MSCVSRRRRWPQFSLRECLVVLTCLCTWFGLLAGYPPIAIGVLYVALNAAAIEGVYRLVRRLYKGQAKVRNDVPAIQRPGSGAAARSAES